MICPPLGIHAGEWIKIKTNTATIQYVYHVFSGAISLPAFFFYETHRCPALQLSIKCKIQQCLIRFFNIFFCKTRFKWRIGVTALFTQEIGKWTLSTISKLLETDWVEAIFHLYLSWVSVDILIPGWSVDFRLRRYIRMDGECVYSNEKADVHN